MKDKDAAFLGIRGLLKSAIDEGNMALALDYARRAQELHPNQEWILRTTYDLEIRNGLWSDALMTGKTAMKTGALSEAKAISDRIAIYLMRYDFEKDNGDSATASKQLKQAYKLNPNYVPTVTRLATYYLKNGKRRKAIKVIEQAWPHSPHPDLAQLWDVLAPSNQNKRLKWSEDLVALNPDSAEAQIAAAKAAMDMNLWGEAKAYLTVAEKIHPSARVFRQRAIVEQNSTQNDDAIHDLMEKAANALPDKKWVCRQTGLTYDSWSAIALPHESFNTIIWDYPGARTLNQKTASFIDQKNTLMIDPAA
jgi:HemY protein